MWYLLFLFIFSAHSSEPFCKVKPLKELAEILGSDQAPECQLPTPGTFKDIDISSKKSLTGVHQIYRLKRTKEGSFEVIFNVKFYRDDDTVDGFDTEADPVLTTQFRKKATTCLREAEGKTNGPNGEKVIFKIYDGQDDESAPPEELVGIKESGRAHAHSWTQDINCSTILHELLHLTGLVDEYPEQSKGFVQDPKTGGWKFVETNAEKTAYDCRKIYPKNSIMAHDDLAWTESVAKWNMQTDYCSCNQADDCAGFFKERKIKFEQWVKKPTEVKIDYPNQCPAGFKKSPHTLKFPIPEEFKKLIDDGKSVGGPLPQGLSPEELDKMTVSFTISPRTPSDNNLLEERHFNMIVFPGCLIKNQNYYQDAMNAYKTSRQNGGKGCADLGWISF